MSNIIKTSSVKPSKRLVYALTCSIINHQGKDYQTAKALAKEFAKNHTAEQVKAELENINSPKKAIKTVKEIKAPKVQIKAVEVKEKPKAKPAKVSKPKEFKRPTNVRSAAWRVVFASNIKTKRFEEYKSILASVSEQGLEGDEAIEYLFNLEQSLVEGTQKTAVISHEPKAKVNSNANIIKLAKALGIKQNPQTKTFKATLTREISRMLAIA